MWHRKIANFFPSPFAHFCTAEKLWIYVNLFVNRFEFFSRFTLKTMAAAAAVSAATATLCFVMLWVLAWCLLSAAPLWIDWVDICRHILMAQTLNMIPIREHRRMRRKNHTTISEANICSFVLSPSLASLLGQYTVLLIHSEELISMEIRQRWPSNKPSQPINRQTTYILVDPFVCLFSLSRYEIRSNIFFWRHADSIFVYSWRTNKRKKDRSSGYTHTHIDRKSPNHWIHTI